VWLDTTAVAADMVTQAELNVFGLVTPTAWATPTLATNWSNLNASSHQTVQYRKNALGNVEIKGVAAKSTALVTPDSIFTLPVGFRPARETLFGTGSNGGYATIRVTVNGDVGVFAGGSNVWTLLSGIFFDPLV
jgi:hypothetical protein